MKRSFLSTFLLVASITIAAAANANEGMRCGSKLIETGMTQAEVLQYCGEPASRSVERVPVRSGTQVVGTTDRHTWTYKSYSATRVLQFDQDKLVSIQ